MNALADVETVAARANTTKAFFMVDMLSTLPLVCDVMASTRQNFDFLKEARHA